MSITIPYFISILLSFPMLQNTTIPPDGWLQMTYEFPNKEICEFALAEEQETIFVAVTRQFLSVPHEIKEIKCMTVEEGAKANKLLGHKPIWRPAPDPKRTVPRV